jgi:hypothetical protein
MKLPSVKASPAPKVPTAPKVPKAKEASDNPYMGLGKAAPTPSSYAGDIAKSFGTGVERGVAGLPGVFGDFVDIGRQVGNWYRGGKPAPFKQAIPNLPTTEKLMEESGLPQHTPETGPGRYAEAIGQMAPGVGFYGAGTTGLARGIAQSVGGGIGSEALSEIGGHYGGKVGETVGGLVGGGVGFGLGSIKTGGADRAAKIFAPETRGPIAQKGAEVIRQESGMAAREQATAFAELGEHRAAQNIMQSGAQATDHVAEDGTRYTPSARQFTDYMDGVGPKPASPQVAEAADKIKPLYSQVRSRIEGLPEAKYTEFKEQYYPIQISQKNTLRAPRNAPEEVRQAGGGASAGFTKRREVYKTTSEVVDKGVDTLKTADPIKATYNYIANAENFLAREYVWERAHGDRIIQYFQMGDKVPVGMGKIEYGPRAQTPGAQAYAPEQFATLWNRWQSPGFNPETFGGAIMTNIRKFNSAWTGMELALNGYHATVMTMEGVISDLARGIHKGATPGMRLGGLGNAIISPLAPIKYAFRGGQGAREYIGKGGQPSKILKATGLRYGGQEAKELTDLLTQGGARMAVGGGQRALDVAIPGGGPLFRAKWKNIAGVFNRATKGDIGAFRGGIDRFRRYEMNQFKEHPYTAVPREIFNLAFKTLDTVATPLFDEYIPRLKNGAMMSQLSDWLRANPGATAEQKLFASRKIVDSMDNRFGEMVHDNIFWSKTAKESLMAAMLSYSWNLGTVREVGGGAIEAARAIHLGPIGGAKRLNLKAPQVDMSFKAAYAIALPMVWGTIAAVYQYAHAGKHLEDMRDYANPRTGGIDPKTGQPERLATFGYIKDIMEITQKGGIENAPADIITNKANPGLNAAMEVWSVMHGMGGEDWQGMPITHPILGAPLAVNIASQTIDLLKHFYQEDRPISLKNYMDMPRGSHIGGASRLLLGMRQAGRPRVDPEGSLRSKQAVVEQKWKRKLKSEQKKKNLEEQ